MSRTKTFSLRVLPLPFERASAQWGWVLFFGLLLALVGLIAIIAPIAATKLTDIFIGWLLVVGGSIQLIQALHVSAWRGALWQMFSGLLFLLAGLFFVVDPVAGAIALTFVLAVFFMIEGISRCVVAFRVRPMRGWHLFLFGGIVGIALGVLLWSEWPASGLWAMGFLLGVNLLISGLSTMSLALILRRGLASSNSVP